MITLTTTILNSIDPTGTPDHHINGRITIEVDAVSSGNGVITFEHDGKKVMNPLSNWSYENGKEKWTLDIITIADAREARSQSKPPSRKLPNADIVRNIDSSVGSQLHYLILYSIVGNDNKKPTIHYPPGDGSGTAGGP